MNRLYLIFSLFIMSVVCTRAQTASVKGQVLTSDGQPAEFVTVGIKDLQIGTITDSKVIFVLKKYLPETSPYMYSWSDIVRLNKILK